MKKQSTAQPPAVGEIVNHENLPKYISVLLGEVRSLKNMLQVASANPTVQEDTMSLDEVCAMIKYSKSSVYGMVSTNSIPHLPKRGMKKLLFSRSEIQKWLRNAEKKSK